MKMDRMNLSHRAGPAMDLDELVDAIPIPATEEMPAHLRAMLNPGSQVYVQSKQKPKLDFDTDAVPGAPGLWRLTPRSEGEQILNAIHGREQIALDPREQSKAKADVSETLGHCHPWLRQELLPRLAPFRAGNMVMYEARLQEQPNQLVYPWCTIGKVFNSVGGGGSGVLVGPNLLLTAGHVAPWGASPWSMEFFPAYRNGPSALGSSFVEAYRGFRTSPEASGKDYVICKLYTPLGNALGWMGTVSFGNEDAYKQRTYVSNGYPDIFAGRQAVEFALGIRDIDSDDPGIELECVNRPAFSNGWSGGPLWLPSEGPTVAGVLSGTEKDEFDPRRAVFAGGRAMVDLVRFGLENWRP